MVANNKAPGRSWIKWWKPWTTSGRSAALSSSKRAPNNPSSILIQISDVEEATGQQAERTEMERNIVPDEAVAFV